MKHKAVVVILALAILLIAAASWAVTRTTTLQVLTTEYSDDLTGAQLSAYAQIRETALNEENYTQADLHEFTAAVRVFCAVQLYKDSVKLIKTGQLVYEIQF